MVHVMLAEFQKHGVLDAGEEMNGIMGHVVNQVSEHEAAAERPCQIAEQQVKNPQQLGLYHLARLLYCEIPQAQVHAPACMQLHSSCNLCNVLDQRSLPNGPSFFFHNFMG